jgi:hypothetical protein
MTHNIISDIDRVIDNYDMDFEKVDKITAQELYTQLKNIFKLDPMYPETWEESKVLVGEYLFEKDSYELLIDKLSSFDDTILLAITSYKVYPWTLYEGHKMNLPELLIKQIRCQYFIFDFRFQEILSETYQNTLLKFRRGTDGLKKNK